MSSYPLILKLDKAGNPDRWINHEEAIRLYTNDRVIANLGSQNFVFRGGINARTQRRSVIEVGSILLTRAQVKNHSLHSFVPHLTNRALFRRDGHICLYCGEQFRHSELTRDHIIPISRGGRDCWENVVTACCRCNNLKGSRLPEECGKKLLAVPYVPNKAEYLFLQNRRIITDQQTFLVARFGKNSQLKQFLF
ncbi:MAG: HNH endonuclease [Gammaproteobacteria bacterium]|nr:HNH endonuclease [Gammaproteobacteria bacterium]MDH5800394.1 HNH endonuclease [Gammaproteobacteria bacterium]